MIENDKLRISPAPHISKVLTTRTVMFDVLIGLLPAVIAAGYYFRERAAIVIGACVVTCVLTEWLCCLIRKKPSTIDDLSAVVTGLILAFSVPPHINVIYLIIGSIFTIIIGKVVFGGLGSNPFNPAMLGRAFLTASFGMAMTTWTVPAPINPDMPTIGPRGAEIVNQVAGTDKEQLQAITQATPLGWVKEAIKSKSIDEAKAIVEKNFTNSALKANLLGYTGGCLGETSALAMIIGGIYILLRRTASFIVPAAVLISAFLFAEVFHIFRPEVFVNPLFHLTSGGLLMCAFFIATDPATNPMTNKGMIIFGSGVGILIMLIRTVGAYPEGIMYAVLVMNAVTPLIDRVCVKKPVGGVPNAA